MTLQASHPSTSQHDCGWAEVHQIDAALKLGRGHLYVTHDARTGDTAASHDDRATGPVESDVWHGELRSVRLEGSDGLQEGRYQLRLEANGQDLRVDLSDWRAVGPAEGSLSVRSADGVLPAILEELRGE